MNRISLTLLCVFLFCGCSRSAGPLISSEYETLQEGDFEFQYPKDWKISSRGDRSDPKQQYVIYYFFNPRYRDLLITIEVTKFPSRNYASDIQSRKVLSEKVRSLRADFAKRGYTHFTFDDKPVMFAGYRATRLTVSGLNNEGDRRKTVVILLPAAENFYVISYQWFSHWTKFIKKRMAELVTSFKLTE